MSVFSCPVSPLGCNIRTHFGSMTLTEEDRTQVMQFLFNMRPTHFLSCRLGCNIHIHFHSIPKDLQDLSVHAVLPCDFQVSRASCRKTSIIHANENHRTHALSINSEMRQPTVVSGYNDVQFILRKEIAIERITSQARTRMYFDCLFLTNPLSPPLSTIHHPRPVSLQRFRIFASARDTYLNSRRAWPQVHSVKDIYLYGVNFCISLASLWTELNQDTLVVLPLRWFDTQDWLYVKFGAKQLSNCSSSMVGGFIQFTTILQIQHYELKYCSTEILINPPRAGVNRP